MGEQCVPAMQDALNEDSASPAEAALALLLALECLPFDAKIGFFKKLYGKVAESWKECHAKHAESWKECGKGFGKGKWKGFGKWISGKGFGKGEWKADMETPTETPVENELVPNAPTETNVQAASTETQQEHVTRLKFPVVVGDGRQLTIEWDCGADPHQVAHSFAQAHGIQPDELPTIVAFVEHAETCTGLQSQGAVKEASEPPLNSKDKDELGLEEQVSKMDPQDEDEKNFVIVGENTC